MDPNFYQVLHIIGISMVFLGYGALLARSMAAPENVSVRKLGSITSGIGLTLILVAGCALISKLGHSFTDTWILVKFVIWLILGALVVLINRKPQLAMLLWCLLIALGATAAIMVYVMRYSVAWRKMLLFWNFCLNCVLSFVFIPHFSNAPVAQLDRAPDYESGG